jgi:hypothetical protein
VVSKRQIALESKASRGLKTERTRKYVSISIRGTTQLSDAGWGFETTSGLRIDIVCNFHYKPSLIFMACMCTELPGVGEGRMNCACVESPELGGG